VLIVGVNDDASVRRLKGDGRPVVAFAQRAEIVAANRYVDWVLKLSDDTPERVLMLLQPDVHCKGAEYAPPHGKAIPELQVVNGYGGKVAFIEHEQGISTSKILEHVRNRTDTPVE
jgi:D-beta-D-heptose 7-phosphate kinase/D-beta-D-heptose 1-phosphate adenosyltransferase